MLHNRDRHNLPKRKKNVDVSQLEEIEIQPDDVVCL